jgi:DNA helicase-4
LIRIQQRKLFRFLADPFGKSTRVMELDGDYIRTTRRGLVTSISLQSLATAPSLRKGMFGTSLTISSGEFDDLTLKGASHQDAHEFSERVKEAWTRFNLAALEKEAARLDRIIAGVLALAAPSRYPSACQIAPLLDGARDLDESLLSKLNVEAIGPERPTHERQGQMPSPPS